MLFFGWGDFIRFHSRSLGKLIICLKRSKSKNFMPENLPQRHWYVTIQLIQPCNVSSPLNKTKASKTIHLKCDVYHVEEVFGRLMFMCNVLCVSSVCALWLFHSFSLMTFGFGKVKSTSSARNGNKFFFNQTEAVDEFAEFSFGEIQNGYWLCFVTERFLCCFMYKRNLTSVKEWWCHYALNRIKWFFMSQ